MDISKEDFIKICQESISMALAASKLGLHFNTFKKYAIKFGCYDPNPSGKGIVKKMPERTFILAEFLKDENIQISRAGLRVQILRHNLIPYKCNICGLDKWNNKSLSLELDHINGKRDDHRKSNIQWLCPNCHSQTSTFRGKTKNNLSTLQI
jgi:predicted RNA-binding Zn-ribbon protein involved in translation (DUF1610 family)